MGILKAPFSGCFSRFACHLLWLSWAFLLSLLVCRPILVLPPADVQVIYCNLTEAENDFYEALFKKSKVPISMGSACGIYVFGISA